jgi:mRNA interferase MazF
MSGLRPGQTVLLNFPFTDGEGFKRRPAMVIRDTGDGDLIVCRVTSKLYDTVFDIRVEDWEKCGLRLPSVVRTHKIATLSSSMVEREMGEIPDSMKVRVSLLLKELVSG